MREVRIRDTLSGAPARLEPRRPPRVGIYACGPTVYSRIHVGNARPYVIPLLLGRFLAHEGYEPLVVINVTDVNDKIYDAARAAGVPSAEHATRMIEAYVEDTDRLGIGRPDAEPLATATIAEIIELIEALIAGEHAYESGGDVYFRVRSFDAYGKLSNRDPDEMDQGEEAGTAQLKESPLDFALWKARKEGEDEFWPSPWGDGRPGWHIECSAMAEKLLGTDFEIHSGGSDLIFPHHENEIAQTEAARGVPLARIWMHNGMVRTDAEKMSKSVGNIFQLSEAIDRFGGPAVVAFLTSGHYRQPLEFSEEALAQAGARIERVRNYLADAPGGRGARCVRERASRGVPRRARRRLQHAASVGRGVRPRRRGQPPAASRRPRGPGRAAAAPRARLVAGVGGGRRRRGRGAARRARARSRRARLRRRRPHPRPARRARLAGSRHPGRGAARAEGVSRDGRRLRTPGRR